MNATRVIKSTIKYVYMHLRVLLVIVSVISNEFCLCYSAKVPATNSLYDDSDRVTVLNNNTLKETLYGSEQAWFVQFYSSWCGHCVQFAPTWKKFAEDIRGWQTVTKVGAMNCADLANSKTCSQYVDVGFPTLRLFKSLRKNGTGDLNRGPRDMPTLRHVLIDHITNQDEPRPSQWPMLSPVGETWVLDFFARNQKPSVKLLAVVFESDDSYTGKELILDMSCRRDVMVVRVVQQALNNPLAKKWNVAGLPSLYSLNPNGEPEQLVKSGSRESFYTTLQAYLNQTLKDSKVDDKLDIMNGKPDAVPAIDRITEDKEVDEQDEIISKKTTSRSVVYMQDLESALLYSLRYEVGLQKVIEGDALNALKAYILALNKYFPGQSYVMDVLNTVQKLLQPYTWVSSDDWSSILNQVQNSRQSGSFLDNKVAWIGCHGSTSLLRGYPCGLWVLFHTLTVSHSTMGSSYSETDSKEVLRAIRDYIQYFFGCRECSDNFAKESANMETSVDTLNEAVLWLWRTHNKVNRRLAGKQSEDPQHPKRQFPFPADCPFCRRAREWSKTTVLQYMRELYGTRNINTTTIHGAEHGAHRFKPPREVRAKYIVRDEVVNEGYMLGINTTDISMCLLLYALCSLLLLAICAYLRRLRIKKFVNHLI